MTTPSTSIYVRPGWTSYTWTYGGASIGASAISAVAFSFDSSTGPQLDRGSFQYSVDGGSSWTTYAMQSDTDGVYVPAAGTLWRFADQTPGDDGTPEAFVMHWKLADGSIVSSNAGVVPDNQPVGMTYEHNYVFTTQQAGDAVAALLPIDTGAPDGGRWVIQDQSQAGLFGVTTNPDTGAAELVIANPGAMPEAGGAISVTMHYYDRYQIDPSGNPYPNTGVTDTFVFTVMPGSTQALPAFGADLTLGAASGAQASPAIAALSSGGFVTAWQGSGNAIWAQVRDASGAASATPFAVSATADSAAEAQPAVAALADGRFVVAYTVQQDGASAVAYRIVEANGSVGQQMAAGAPGNASMAGVTALADGSFVLGWTSGGQVHLLHESATGSPVGAEQVAGALGSAYSPSVTALSNGDYVVAWGEIGDGNVYAALGSSPGAAIQVTGDGAAASVSTAAPLAHVAALAGGGFVVAWDSYRNDPFGMSVSDIFFQRYDNAGNALAALEQANALGGTGRFDASVAALPDGGFVIGWQAQGGDGDANGVFGRRFGADGVPADAQEFQVNQMAVGDQASPALAVLGNGGVATAWVDTQDGGSTIEARVLAGSGAAGTGAGGAVTPAPGTTSGGGSTGTGAGDTGSSGSGSTGGSTGSGSTGSGGSGTGGGGSVTVPAPAPELVTGTGAANVFTSAGGSHAIDGGAGLDTVVYQASHAGVTITAGTSGFTVSGNGIQDALVNVERLQFSDASLALDINGSAGEAYRLYQAAFDRAPDLAGLGYWIKMLDNGASLNQVSQEFVGSQEFASRYGANASDSQFVQALYQNVLHRPAEPAGYDFWMASLEQYGATRADVLAHFSESLENQAQVVGSIQDGILFTPWG